MKFYEISEEEYRELLKDSKTLEVLREYGVDNWDGYEDAINENEDYINDCEDILDVEPIREDCDINMEYLKKNKLCVDLDWYTDEVLEQINKAREDSE